MSVVTYNGITLPYAFHSSFNQSAVFDESGTDWVGQDFELRVMAVLNAAFIGSMGGAAGGDGAAIMKSIRDKLLQPRQKLQVNVNGTDLLPVGNSVGVDAYQGPKTSCEITSLGNTTFLITFHARARYWSKNNSTSGNTVLTNRWSETAQVDQQGFITRIRAGQYTIRADNSRGQQAFDVMPLMISLNIPPGYLRKSGTYRIDPNGLTMHYEMVDQQQYVMPPAPAYKAEGEYVESTPTLGGARYADCWIKLYGPPGVAKAKLIEAAVVNCSVNLIAAGSPGAAANGGTRSRIISCAVKTSLYTNDVHVTMKAMIQPSAGGKARLAGVAGINFNNISNIGTGNAPGAIPGAAAPRTYFDTSGKALPAFLLQAAQYFDAANAGLRMDQNTGVLTGGIPVGKAGRDKGG